MRSSARARSRAATRLRPLLAGLLVLLSLVALPSVTTASASTQVVAGSSYFEGIACVSATTCFAATSTPSTSQGDIVEITDGVPGAVTIVPGTNVLQAIACPTSTLCVAVGQVGTPAVGAAVLVVNGVPEAAVALPSDAGLAGVACPTVTLCVAVGATASSVGILVPLTIAGTSLTIGTGTTLAGTIGINAVACPDAADCVAAGVATSGAGVIVSMTVGTSPSSLTPGTLDTAANSRILIGIACPTATTCLAVGIGTLGGGVVVAYSSFGGAGSAQAVTGTHYLSAIACPTPSTCTAVGVVTVAHVTVGVTASIASPSGTPSAASDDSSVGEFDSIACTVPGLCFAGGLSQASEGTVTTIAGPAPGAPTSAPGTASLNSLACTAVSSCVAVGTGPTTVGEGVASLLVDGFAYPASLIAGTTALNDLVCPTGTTCVAAGTASGASSPSGGALVLLSANPDGTVSETSSVLVVANAVTLNGLACPTGSSACVAVGLDAANVGVVVPVAVASSGGVTSVTTGSAVTVPGTVDLSRVACPSPGTCIAVGQTGAGAGAVVGVAVGASTATPGGVSPVASASNLDSIACPGSTNCLASGETTAHVGVGVPISVSGGTPTPGAVVAVPGTSTLTAVSCPTAVACQLAGSSSSLGPGLVVPFALTGATATPGTVTTVAGSLKLQAITCPTPGSCQVVGYEDLGFFTSKIGLFAPALLDDDLTLATAAPRVAVATSPSGAAVTYAIPIATDATDATDSTVSTPSCSPSSGSTFSIGESTVSCSTTDADDTPPTETSSFTVTVDAPGVPFVSAGGLAPAAGPVSGGTAVTITGTGFVPGATVHFGSVPATAVTVLGPTTIDAVAPSQAVGQVGVTVTTWVGTSNAATFTYSAAPIVSPTTTSPPASTSTGNTSPLTSAPATAGNLGGGGPSLAPPPRHLPGDSFARPTSRTVVRGSLTRLTVRGSASVTVPAGALPARTIVSLYPARTLGLLRHRLPPGERALAAFGISWVTPSADTARAARRVTAVFRDRAIHPGDRVEEVTATGLRLVAHATRNGIVEVSTRVVGTFVVVAVPRPAPTRPVVRRTGATIALVLGCDPGAPCRGRALLSVARRSVPHGRRPLVHVVLAEGRVLIRAGSKTRIELLLTAAGRQLLAHRPDGVAVSLLVVLVGGGRRVERVVLP